MTRWVGRRLGEPWTYWLASVRPDLWGPGWHVRISPVYLLADWSNGSTVGWGRPGGALDGHLGAPGAVEALVAFGSNIQADPCWNYQEVTWEPEDGR